MEFIIDNIVWFIIGFVVILMTIIGYIADKTNFGKEKFIVKTTLNKSEKEKKIKDNKKEDKKAKETIIKEDKKNDKEVIEENLNIPFGDKAENPVVEEAIKEEDLTVPLDDEKIEIKNDLPLPEIDTLNDKIDEDDVWKF
ncbi:MAG: hypothetical protein PHE54_04965 [Bacilli bacterium]|nr:hypothetical protein [Bacilli bacterium]